ncbi:MAG: SRPBCC family protein [Myxococcaceae bacterium]
MTAVADVQAGVVRATVEIAALPEAVFRALTDPAELPRWWGSPDLYRTNDWKVDLRPGGKWSCQARSPQGDSEVRGEYLAIEPPRLLEYTWEPAWEQYRQTIIRCTLEAIPGGTRVSVVHRGFTAGESATGHAEGWTRVLGWLAGRFAGTHTL